MIQVCCCGGSRTGMRLCSTTNHGTSKECSPLKVYTHMDGSRWYLFYTEQINNYRRFFGLVGGGIRNTEEVWNSKVKWMMISWYSRIPYWCLMCGMNIFMLLRFSIRKYFENRSKRSRGWFIYKPGIKFLYFIFYIFDIKDDWLRPMSSIWRLNKNKIVMF